MLNNDTKQKFIELRAKGYSFDSISKQLNTSKPTLLKLNRELAADINKHKFLELEGLAEQYKMLRTARLEALNKLLDRVDTALETADFGRLPADKLVEVRQKISEKMQAELQYYYTEKSEVSTMFDKEMDYSLGID